MRSFVGTIWSGPQEGTIIKAEYPQLVMPDPPSPGYIVDQAKLPEVDISCRQRDYEFRLDDDMRGWWVER